MLLLINVLYYTFRLVISLLGSVGRPLAGRVAYVYERPTVMEH